MASLLAILLSGCLPDGPTPEPTVTLAVTPSLTATRTATIQWFPATATPTPFATEIQAVQQDMKPAVGAVLFSDDFRSPGVWLAAPGNAGNVGYGKNELTLAVNTSKGEAASLLPKRTFSDFYMEVEVQPSLCRGEDAFGVLIRAASAQETDRVLMNCNGKVRVEREKSYAVTALREWTTSGQVLPGALLKTRLGVWAVGSELRIFINDQYQFSARETALLDGQVGMYARAAADTPVTVNFANLQIRSVDAAHVPTVVPTPTLTVRPTSTRLPTATNQP